MPDTTDREKKVPGLPDRTLEKAVAIAREKTTEEALVHWTEIHGHKVTQLVRSDGKELTAGNNTLLLAELIKLWMEAV